MIRLVRIGLEVMLVVMVCAYAAAVIRDYSRYAAHYPYIATDDGLANVSYALATEGRYGFMTSPVQGFTDIMRDRGFFNYGPWYFYSGAALIWLFGYSLTMLRAMHLAGILAIAVAGAWCFGRRGHLAAGAVIAVGLLHSFALGQWPMVRPDIAVSVFAIVFIVAAGLAIEKASALWWFVAGLGAGCAALTHLIAWALVPCWLATFAIAIAVDWPGRRRAVTGLAAGIFGLAAATFMFYASFGFRIRDHLQMIQAYSGYLGGTPGVSTGPRGVLAEHLRIAFGYLGPWVRAALGASVLANVLMLAAAWRLPRDARNRAFAAALPPTMVLLSYGLSLGAYPSYHSGYAILLQVGAWWCAGTALSLLVSRLPVSRHLGQAALAALIVGVSGTLVFGQASNPRLGLIQTWVGFQGYLDKIGTFMPRGATVWSTGVNGIESPGRYELIEFIDGVNILQRSRAKHLVDSSAVAPQYLMWDYRLNRENLLQTLDRTRMPPNQGKTTFGNALDALASVRYRVIGLIAAPPYGVARVYARMPNAPEAPTTVPVVSAYDIATQSWHERLDPPMALETKPSARVQFNIDFRSAAGSPADRSVVSTLPPGRYLLRVRVTRSWGSSGGTLICATSSPSVTERIGELGPSFDVAPYAEGDDEAYLVREHPGGPIYISQFDNAQRAGIEGVDAFRIRPQLDDDQVAARSMFRALPLDSWVGHASPGVRARLTESGSLAVEGNASRTGYQISSPAVPGRVNARVTLRAGFAGQQGAVCLGALNGTGAKWLANGGNPARDFSFTVDETGAFQVVFYNCNASDAGNVESRFTVSSTQYAVESTGFYVDRLLEVRDPVRAAALVAADARVRSFPAGLAVTSDEIGRIQLPLSGDDMSFSSAIASHAAGGWTIAGRADGPFSYLLKSKPQTVDDDRRLVAHLRVRTGGVTIGLLRNNAWAGQVNLTGAGEYIAVLQPPARGVYEVVVANNLSGPSLATDVAVTSLGWVPR